MNWYYEIDRIAAQHRDAVRRMEYCIEDIDAAARARSRALSERWYAQFKEAERRKTAESEAENEAAAVRAAQQHRDAHIRGALTPGHWTQPAVDPVDWNADAEDFPKPKSWLV